MSAPAPTGPRGRFISLLAVLLLFTIFVLQNASSVSLHFLLWSFSMSRSLMVVVILLLGIAIGWGWSEHFHYMRKDKRDRR